MSAIEAIRSVVSEITEPVAAYATSSTTLEVDGVQKGRYKVSPPVWVGAWIELFGASQDTRYQVVAIERVGSKKFKVTVDAEFEVGLTSIAILLDYQFGHSKEIQQTLAEQSRDTAWKAKLYPKLILFLDIDEEVDNLIAAPLSMAICTSTDKDWKAADREVESFQKVLHPLYHLFVGQLELAPGIDVTYPVLHTRVDRYFWGNQPSDEQNVFAALLDAVEITNLAVTIHEECINNDF